jgi:hypothetical protein
LEGSTSTSEIDRFTLTFSEDLAAATVNNGASYDLRAAGADHLFDTVDDQIYVLISSPTYSSGATASYRITDGPLHPDLYRFTAKTSPPDRLTDRAGNPLGAAFTRTFSVVGIAPFVLEGRSDDTLGTATFLSPAAGSASDGSFAIGASRGVGSNPNGVASGLLNSDSHLDLVTANYSSNNVSVLLGNGDGSFQTAVNYAVAGNPINVVVGDLDGDGKADLITANNGSTTVSVLKGNGDGSFQAAVNYTVGSAPQGLALIDVSGDGKLDLITANNKSSNVSVLLGTGTVRFAA